MSPHPKLASLAGPALRMQPDARLARLAGEGSEPAFEEIVRRYRLRLVAFAAAIVPAHRAEDIVQESLKKAVGALHDCGGEVQLKAWLYTIVRNRALNAVRDEKVHVELDEQYDGVTPPPEILARREEVAALVAGLQALPEAQRQALLGRELEGLSHADIAARMGTSPASVRGLIFRARTAVRHAAGALVPLPALRWLMSEAPSTPGAGDAAAGAGLAAAGVATAGGGGVAVKAGAVLAAGVIAAGAGVGLRSGSDPNDSTRAEAAQTRDGQNDENSHSSGGSNRAQGEASGKPSTDPAAGTGQAAENRGHDEGNSGPGGGHGAPASHSGPGGGGGEPPGGPGGPGGHSGPGGGGGGDQGGHDGPGGGGDEPDGPDDDGNSGPGGDDGGHSQGPGGGDEDIPEPPDDEPDDAPDDGHGGPGPD